MTRGILIVLFYNFLCQMSIKLNLPPNIQNIFQAVLFYFVIIDHSPSVQGSIPVVKYLFKVNNKDTKKHLLLFCSFFFVVVVTYKYIFASKNIDEAYCLRLTLKSMKTNDPGRKLVFLACVSSLCFWV